jgi:hypothetical protein
MAAYTVKRFGGSSPRVADHLLGDHVAGLALDCKFWHGTLDAWRELRLVRAVSEGTVTSFLHDQCWLDWDTCVDIAQGPVTCREFYTTGDEPWPAIVSLDPSNCIPTIRRLGVPCGDQPLMAVAGVAGTYAPKDTESRVYAYQYMNERNERGSLSMASTPITVMDGQEVTVSNWPVPDISWGVTHVRIFRAVSGHQTGREPGNVFDTVWMHAGDALINSGVFVDSLPNDELFEALEQDVADPPPAELRGIVWIESMNCLAGFVGNRLFFSENNSYHEWPYHIDLDDNICAIIENNGLIYVATDGSPYVVPGASECQNAGCRKAVRLPVKYPMVGCGNRRMAKTPSGAVYPTHDGLVALSGASAPQLVTTPLYAPDDWHKLRPETVMPVSFNGHLFVFGRGGSFVLTLANGPEAGWPLDTHSELSDTDVIDAFVSRTGDFYLVKADGVYQWDRGAVKRPYTWQSPEIVSPVPINFAAAHAVFRGPALNVKLTVDGRTAIDRPVLSSRVFTLPMWALGTRWQVTLQGTATVSLYSTATSMKELGA